MLSMLGRLVMLLGLAACAVGVPAGWIAGWRKSPSAYALTRAMAWVFSGSMVVGTTLMEVALLTHDFRVGYVAEVGSTTTPLHITIVSLWSSLNGSILFWLLVLGLGTAVFTWTMRNRNPQQSSYAIGTLLFVGAFFCFLVAGPANPFDPTPLPDGLPAEQVEAFLNANGMALGPNGLLQNHLLMVIHPPALYLGYVTMSVPFAMATASLMTGRMEASWLRTLRRWLTFSWSWLTLGIMLGGWWSYEVLGWGGYWAWDPVENASFMPWLTATAFLHSAQVTEKRGKLKGWTISLAQWTFGLTILGTFLTRSGVVESVHAFGSGIGPPLLVFLALVVGISVVLFALRAHLIEGQAGGLINLRGRSLAFLLQNLLFGAWTGTVLLGTLYPVITEAFDGARVSVGEPYFDKMTLPVVSLIIFVMGVGPALPWGEANLAKSGLRLLGPTVSAVVTGAVLFALGLRDGWALLTFGLCAFAGWTSLWELFEPAWKRARARQEPLHTAFLAYAVRSRSRVGAYVAHVGVVMLAVGVAASTAYKRQVDVAVPKGETVEVFPADDEHLWAPAYRITYLGYDNVMEPHRTSDVGVFRVERGGNTWMLHPRINYYAQMGNTALPDPAVHTRFTHDLYLSPTVYQPEMASLRVMVHPLIWMVWVGAFVMMGGGFLAATPAIAKRREQKREDKKAKVDA